MNWSFSYEPAVWIGVGDALIVLAITFGAPITAEQKGAADAVLAALAAVLIRSQVTPVAKIGAPPDLPEPAAVLVMQPDPIAPVATPPHVPEPPAH